MAAQPARRLAPSPTPFADAALELHSYGLAVIPLGGDDGKVPLDRFAGWKGRPSRQYVESKINQHPTANVGVLTGLSGYTVVDIDDPALTDRMLARFGATPLKTATPRGGVHLWFKYNGERSRIQLDGLKVDVKAKGGMVVVPPSIRPTGEHAGKVYGFREGSWEDLARLPTLKPGSLYDGDKGYVPDGQRGDTLFKHCLRQVRHCDDVDTLLDVARTFNVNACVPELPDAEVVKTARSAWKIQQDGKNRVGGPPQVVLPATDIDRFAQAANGADALMLLTFLKCNHGGRHEPFALVVDAMKEANVLGGWGRDRYRNAIKTLMKLSYLVRVHVGGRGPNSPHKYRLK